ncbi:MAG: hydrogenase maturation protease [Deltaproteobacteria bacterium]|nr:hydrogenase maturation protease [Deltaproteobacteria bacterium]
MPGVLVVCVGNDLVADDGVGPAVYEHLRRRPQQDGVRLSLLGVGGLELLDELEGDALLIVVDAVLGGARPGTISVRRVQDDDLCRPPPTDAHAIGVLEALAVGRALFPGVMPREIVLVGVEGQRFGEVGPMTGAVAAAAERAAGVVADLCAEVRGRR